MKGNSPLIPPYEGGKLEKGETGCEILADRPLMIRGRPGGNR